jgi:predicted alpha-1,2-mannosidase
MTICLRRVAPAMLLVLALTGSASAQGSASSPYDSVDPMIGTAGGGNTFPGATLPFGMMQWSPDTGSEAWYRYDQHRITGFSLTHISGAGCPLYGDFPVLPWSGDLTVSPRQDRELYTQPFDHARESAHPGFYSVTLENGMGVEITVSERAGIARYTFPPGTPARLLLNSGGSANMDPRERAPNTAARADDGGVVLRLVGNNGVEGQVSAGGFCGSPTHYTLYFAAEFEQPVVGSAMWNEDTVERSAREEKARFAGAWLDFGDRRTVTMRAGLSYVSVENARANLKAEIPSWNFEAVHAAARKRWSELLDRVAIRGGTADQRTIFYTGLYHMLLSPNLFSDLNGQYMGFDDKVHTLAATQHAQYANYSDWDIYRNVLQLQALLEPNRVGDMAQSLVNDADQSGWLPRWPAANDVTYVMGGDSPDILLADAYAFGARNFDVHAALHFMIHGATDPGNGPHGEAERPGLAEELRLGYVPVDHDVNDASRTLEYASDDFAIAQLARATGDQGAYKTFLKRAGDWQNLLDPETKWIRPRNANGSWLAGFDADRSLPKKKPDAPASGDQDGFEEGNTWQYSFMVPFDYPRLVGAMGGNAAVVPRLDQFFSKLICWGEPCFNMANEPDFVTPYVYEYTDAPWKTDDVVTRVEQQTFSTKPDGIPGNDDLGATSGVYVWNALGLYPGVPGVGGMFIGTPMFPAATLHLAEGRTLVIRSEGSGVYARSLSLNGQPYNRLWLPSAKVPAHSTTVLRFTLQSDEPAATTLQAPPVFRP